MVQGITAGAVRGGFVDYTVSHAVQSVLFSLVFGIVGLHFMFCM